jgi:acetoin utilization deacetylase AcuC-like enzyme
MFASTHQSPLFPGTGAREERGQYNNIVNCPLPAGAGTEAFQAAMSGDILPAVEKFNPQLLMISAGFDAHERDPLAQLRFSADDFAWATRELLDVADRCCDGRVVSALEGGYDMTGLAESCAAHVRELMER